VALGQDGPGAAGGPGGAVSRRIAPRGAVLEQVAAGGVVRPDQVDVAGLDVLVVSPGWAPHAPLLVRARAAGVPIWSEVELAWRLRANPAATWLVITGTNGKTTTVQMLEAILRAAGRRAQAAGNVGTPLIQAVADPTIEVFAVELSSFQLHHSYSLRPLAAAVLNIAPDHLDWHGSMEAYTQAKGRALAGASRAVIYNAADPAARRLAEQAEVARGVRRVGFTLAAPLAGQVGLADGFLVDRAFYERGRRGALELASLEDLMHLAAPSGRLAPHVVEDGLAAAALALAAEVGSDGIGSGLRAYRPGAHRLTEVVEVQGVRFVDDSKATNAHAAAASLAGFAPGSVVWLAGGLAKGARFDDLVARRADRLKAAVLIGRDQTALAEALARHAPEIPVVTVPDLSPVDDAAQPVPAATPSSAGVLPGAGPVPAATPGSAGVLPGAGAGPASRAMSGRSVMDRAVAQAARLAASGDVVLLAPASASMDQFKSYAERGDLFAEAARRLACGGGPDGNGGGAGGPGGRAAPGGTAGGSGSRSGSRNGSGNDGGGAGGPGGRAAPAGTAGGNGGGNGGGTGGPGGRAAPGGTAAGSGDATCQGAGARTINESGADVRAGQGVGR
jgi:UDP-N-acetylmuramoylalanine--D-glutamate ligase